MPARAPRPAIVAGTAHVAEVQAAPDPEDIPVPAMPGDGAPVGPPDGGPALGGCPPPPPNQALVIDVQQRRPAAVSHRLKDGRDPWWRGEWTDQENRSFLARVRRFQGKPPGPCPWGMLAKTFKTRVGYQCRNHYWAMVEAGVTMPFVLPAPSKRPFKARKRTATALPAPRKSAFNARKSRATEVTDEAEETALQEEGNTGASEEGPPSILTNSGGRLLALPGL